VPKVGGFRLGRKKREAVAEERRLSGKIRFAEAEDSLCWGDRIKEVSGKERFCKWIKP